MVCLYVVHILCTLETFLRTVQREFFVSHIIDFFFIKIFKHTVEEQDRSITQTQWLTLCHVYFNFLLNYLHY